MLIERHGLAADYVEQQRNLLVAVATVSVSSGGCRSIIAQQLADGLEVVQQVRGIFSGFGLSIGCSKSL